MPTDTGGETISERLTRLRTELTRVRATIERHESMGQSWNIGGAAVSQIAYERALTREGKLAAQIAALEARLAGAKSRPGLAISGTSMP